MGSIPGGLGLRIGECSEDRWISNPTFIRISRQASPNHSEMWPPFGQNSLYFLHISCICDHITFRNFWVTKTSKNFILILSSYALVWYLMVSQFCITSKLVQSNYNQNATLAFYENFWVTMSILWSRTWESYIA